MRRATQMSFHPHPILYSYADEHDFPLPRGILHLLRFRRKCKNRCFKCLAFGEVTELRHGFEFLAPNWGPVIRLLNVFRLDIDISKPMIIWEVESDADEDKSQKAIEDENKRAKES